MNLIKKVTIKTVASAVGVANSTVARALNNSGYVDEEKKKRIIETANRLGYQPSRVARALSRKPLNIGITIIKSPIYISDMYRSFFDKTFEEYEDFNINYSVYECVVSNEPDGLYLISPDKLDDFVKSIDGIINYGRAIFSNYDLYRAITERQIPAVSIHSSVFPRCVTVDSEALGMIAAEFLKVVSAKNVAMISGTIGSTYHESVYSGFAGKCAEIGINVLTKKYCFDDFNMAHEITADLLENYPQLNGIYTSSYVAPAICACLRKCGKENAVEVIGTDVTPEIAKCINDGSLSATLYQSQKSEVHMAVEMMTKMLDGNNGDIPENIYIKPEIVMKSNLKFYL